MKINRPVRILLVLLVLLAGLSLIIYRGHAQDATPPTTLNPAPAVGQDVPTIDLTEAFLSAVIGIGVSATFAWLPGLRTWFAGLRAEFKSLTIIGTLATLTIFFVALGCNGYIHIKNFTCSKADFVNTGMLFIIMLASNQTIHRLISAYEPVDVQIAKATRPTAKVFVVPPKQVVSTETLRPEDFRQG